MGAEGKFIGERLGHKHPSAQPGQGRGRGPNSIDSES